MLRAELRVGSRAPGPGAGKGGPAHWTPAQSSGVSRGPQRGPEEKAPPGRARPAPVVRPSWGLWCQLSADARGQLWAAGPRRPCVACCAVCPWWLQETQRPPRTSRDGNPLGRRDGPGHRPQLKPLWAPDAVPPSPKKQGKGQGSGAPREPVSRRPPPTPPRASGRQEAGSPSSPTAQESAPRLTAPRGGRLTPSGPGQQEGRVSLGPQQL